MALSLMAICALIVAFRYLSAWYRLKKGYQKDDLLAEDNDVLAEIEGKTWPQLSVFEHIERGLKKNPHGPAVVCLMEQSSSVQNLVAACSEAGEENKNNNIQSPCLTPTLWSRDRSRVHPPNLIEDIPPDNPAREVKKTAFTLTYTQLHHTALKVATGLLAVGVQPNTNMIMLIPNGAEYAILLWACILLRITYINLDPGALDISGFTTLKQTIKIIRPQLVVVPDAYSGKAIDVAISELGLPQPVRVYLSDSSAVSTGWKSLFGVATHINCHDFSDSASLVSAARRRDMNRINSIMFTSGTSGMPKGCPQSVAAISHALNSQEWLIDSDSGAAKYALMQPHNSRGIAPVQTLQTWRAGGAVVLTGQSFSVHDAIKAIEQLGASFLVLTPPMVHEFASALATVSLDLSCVKRIQIGGDAVTKDVLVRCAALFPQAQICVNQGMTEGPGVFTWPFLETDPKNIPCFGDQICPVGVVAPGARIRLSSTTCDGVVKRGEIGELHISCPSIIRCYLGGYSEDVFYNDTKGRWFNTKDMAMVDNHGLVFIMGRRRDMITRAGVTIAPAAIESCIANFTQSQAVVVPVPHSVLGAEPIAVLESLTNVNLKDVKKHVRITLGEDYALGGVVCLKQLGFVDFPVNATHKIIKSELQEAVLKYWKSNQNGLTTREEKVF